MEPLAIQRCIEVKQEIGLIEKKIVETSFDLKIDHEYIHAKTERFSIKSILDISFRLKEEKAIGYLYIHTTKGIRTFHIRHNPIEFINVFKKLRSETTEYE
ncbi:hypothetical protein [Alkalihalobacillus pseudalcaliphilus]|uniref:hypothetical protein n=1 Tax=Alkalihalobacillus pseudalcaliphilus TaxID=79884 RepID=UPI00064DCC08|nr:hypothetical protein [Alkalihalobacillus pseudalcaliphilus]KMK75729.1 hypothetical protein AB990_10650 [Alkalihalobacillus pseudalcaliphilus]